MKTGSRLISFGQTNWRTDRQT